jgi:L-threonylcarbamoyladenylate synthase
MSDDALDQAAAIIKSGGVVAYPTEAVYGFGCDPMQRDAVLRVLALKERSVFDGLLLIAADPGQLSPFVEPFTEEIEARVQPTWPGPYSWLVPADDDLPVWIRGRHPRVGVRVTAHPIAAELCRLAGTALVSTSANLHGEAPMRNAAEIIAKFGDRIDCVVPGECGGLDHPTSIRDAVTGVVLR